MTAAYRLKGIGWIAVLAGIVLGFYLVSLRVATERKALDVLNARIMTAERDIRALETEFDTRANLAQLEKWNGEALALAAPVAAQFVADEAQLAALDPGAPAAPAMPGVRTAALVVPSLPEALPAPVQPPLQASVQHASVQQASFQRVAAALSPVRVAASPSRMTIAATAQAVAPTGRGAPALARLTEAARGVAAVAKVRPQAVAMLDRKLLSDTTFGDILASARAEARHP